MQGAGNDFVVIETKTNRRDWSNLAIEICDRHYGVGADGLLIALPSKVADFKMRILNADGSESAVCGNGLRCLIMHYLDSNPNRHDSTITIETSIGLRTAKINRENGKIKEILVNMGAPGIGLNCTPVKEVSQKSVLDITYKMNHAIKLDSKELLLSLVSIGNPHAVYFYNGNITDFPLAKLGSKVEQHKLFPDETNFEVVRIISRKKVEAIVWERGVGETLACGSGACAIVVAGNLLGWLDKKVDVILPGGTLKVNWDTDKDANIYLSGPTDTVFHGEW